MPIIIHPGAIGFWTTPRPLEKEKVWIEGESLFLTGGGGDMNSKETRSVLLERQEETK
ncbi:MAG: hypothetical protein SPF69_04150 [Candidatus Ornithospirochaeta sp.]|nr:hypothetical protein [Sphaerochaetaceae bacterium]MDY5523262.1 hypothetical protein [Candidatus Ornithospirochaeta sp.]